jgi:hypothetical protein
MSSLFLQIIQTELKNTNYDLKYSTMFDDLRVVTLFWEKSGLIMDLLLDGDECILTTPNTGYIFVFYEDDIEEVALDVVKIVKEFEIQ